MNEVEKKKFDNYIILIRNGEVKDLINLINSVKNPLHMGYNRFLKLYLEQVISEGDKKYYTPENGYVMDKNRRLYVKITGDMLNEMAEYSKLMKNHELTEYFDRLVDENVHKAKISIMTEVDLKEEFLTTAKDFQKIFFESVTN